MIQRAIRDSENRVLSGYATANFAPSFRSFRRHLRTGAALLSRR
jgi:hypothetical protein